MVWTATFVVVASGFLSFSFSPISTGGALLLYFMDYMYYFYIYHETIEISELRTGNRSGRSSKLVTNPDPGRGNVISLIAITKPHHSIHLRMDNCDNDNKRGRGKMRRSGRGVSYLLNTAILLISLTSKHKLHQL